MVLDYNYHKEECEKLFRDHYKVKWSPDSHQGSTISQFYEGKTIFLTGATGFLGKLMVEKLLRACPGIKAIYILVRSKKGEDEKTRVDKLYSDEIFSVLREVYPNFTEKIHVVTGDVALPDAGMTLQDQRILIDDVNVIFHIAATVRFDEKLPIAVNTNVRAVRDLLKLAKKCQHLACFLHVSTAYANCNRDKIDEVIYDPSMGSDDLIQIVSEASDATLSILTPKIRQGWPNTYTFTKQVAEHVVKTYSDGLPVCIFRPAIVTATYKEPLRSWIDNFYGVTGIITASGTGLLKTMRVRLENSAELVPADFVINGMIAAVYKTANDENTKEIPIYNYASSTENRHTWNEVMVASRDYGRNFVSIRCVWIDCLFQSPYKSLHFIRGIFLHFLVAVVMDLVMRLTNQKPMMLKIYKKIVKFESVIAFFATNQWKFGTRNTQDLYKGLSDIDKRVFPFDIKDLDWDEFHRTHVLGIRVHLAKDDLSTLPEARRKWKKMLVAHYVIKSTFYLILLGLFYSLVVRLYGTITVNYLGAEM